MALDWFPFNTDAYTGDTSHLTCEEHGAYLLLMLAYYRSERPLPATDRALSSITKLPMDRWLECKPTLAPFFIEQDGVWRHARIEDEIVKGHERMERFSKRAKAANDAKYKDRRRNPSPLLEGADKGHTLTLTKDSLSTVRDVEEKELKGTVQAEPDLPPIERPLSPINPQFQPSEAFKVECVAWMDPASFHIEWQKFVFDARDKGKMSADWDASFRIWIERFRAYATKPRGKPRVQLNPDPPVPDEPVKINWTWHLSRWLKDESSWRRRTAGPEPGQIGCRVPAEMFQQFGIDQATGRKKQTEKT